LRVPATSAAAVSSVWSTLVPTHIAREYPTLVFVGGTKMDEGAAAA